MKLSHIYIICAAALLTTACTSEAEQTSDVAQGSQKQMTFTVSQEGDSGAQTRVAFNNETKLIWEAGDKIGIYDGTSVNLPFTLIGSGGTTIGAFEGEANESGSYTAVYPYSADMTISDGSASNVTLKSTQTATPNSFDKTAAIFIAQSSNKKLEFKTAVSFVKVTTSFACRQIVLSANEDIAGTGTLKYNSGEPSITFDSDQSKTITLKPASETTAIAAGTYYIVVPAGNLSCVTISFTASDEYCVYTRTSTQSNTFNRSKIKDLGTFSTTGTWTHTSRGKVNASQEVDMGVFDIGGTEYRLIFTKSNLIEGGLAENEYDYGDYFAWGALEPWYSSYSGTSLTVSDLKPDKQWGGYSPNCCPSWENDSEYVVNNVLKMEYDAARHILGGDWQLPTEEIWDALWDADGLTVDWGDEEFVTIDGSTNEGIKITKKGDTSTYLFLPAAGRVFGFEFQDVGSYGYYWSVTASGSTTACDLEFDNGSSGTGNDSRFIGNSVRPVRLVAVN